MCDKKIVGIIMAAGSGTRMESDIPKQFMTVKGKPMLMHSVDLFRAEDGIDAVVVTASPGTAAETKNLIGDDDRVTVVIGGETRNESLYRALSWIRYNISADAYVITHDAARPYLTEDVLREHVRMSSGGDACTTAFPAVDTVAISADGRTIDAVPERRSCWQLQTPQSFFAREYMDIYSSLAERELEKITDATGVFLLRNRPVRIIMGDAGNRKVSYKDDLPNQ